MRPLSVLLTMTVLAAAACGQCWGVPARPAVAAPYEWHHYPDQDSARLYLCRGSAQHGVFDGAGVWYRGCDARGEAWRAKEYPANDGDVQRGQWGSMPIPLPRAWLPKQQAAEPIAAPKEERVANFGVDRDRISGHERITLNGQTITKAQAAAYLAGDARVPNDADLVRLTVIGSDAERAKVLSDLVTDKDLLALKSRLVVQDYRPDEWAVARAGFFTGGHPTIYLQRPDGKVLHRQDEYAGPVELATAIRKADPNYQPAKDPNLLKPQPLNPESWPTWVWLVAGGALLLSNRQKEPQP